MQFFGALATTSDVCHVQRFCEQAFSLGGFGLTVILEVFIYSHSTTLGKLTILDLVDLEAEWSIDVSELA